MVGRREHDTASIREEGRSERRGWVESLPQEEIAVIEREVRRTEEELRGRGDRGRDRGELKARHQVSGCQRSGERGRQRTGTRPRRAFRQPSSWRGLDGFEAGWP